MSEPEKIPESGQVDKSKLYVGDKKVRSYGVSDAGTTPAGGRFIHIEYDDDTTELLTEANFDAVKGYQKSDATKRREKLVKNAGAKLYALLMEYGPKLGEVDHILNETVRLANDATEEAINTLWGVKYTHERSILDVNRILADKYNATKAKTEEDNGAAS